MSKKKEKPMGIYTHFKGMHKYEALATAYDFHDTEYIIYQAQYGDKKYWLRKKDSFFASIEIEGKRISRFKLESPEDTSNQLQKLVSSLRQTDIVITDEDSGIHYKIVQITNEKVHVCQLESGAYLSNVELAYRMGYTMLSVNDEIIIRESTNPICEESKLQIVSRDESDAKSIIEKQFNPCSIDLHISDTMFIRTKHFKSIDPTSLKNIVVAKNYWKQIQPRNNCIRLRPKQSVLTNIYEKIKIPNNCAGKIEIKSTYSRLSLSITEGDFCNPGYEGHFPLVIRNDGNHTVVIHPKEMMAQLILVRVSDSIIGNYSQNATHINTSGFDDGTPYSFWYERSIKNFRKQNGAELFYCFYKKVLDGINKDTSEDINAEKERFTNKFLPFVCKELPNLKKNVDSQVLKECAIKFVSSEKRKRRLCKSKLFTGIFGITIEIIAFVSKLLSTLPDAQKNVFIEWIVSYTWALIILGITLILTTVIIRVKQPKIFCTFEKTDLEEVAKSVLEDNC